MKLAWMTQVFYPRVLRQFSTGYNSCRFPHLQHFQHRHFFRIKIHHWKAPCSGYRRIVGNCTTGNTWENWAYYEPYSINMHWKWLQNGNALMDQTSLHSAKGTGITKLPHGYARSRVGSSGFRWPVHLFAIFAARAGEFLNANTLSRCLSSKEF